MPNQTVLEKELTIERDFEASRAMLWRAWTEPEIFKKWWGPLNLDSFYFSLNLKVGGKFLCGMRGPEGKDFWITGRYIDIVPLEKLVMTNSFANERGNVVPATYYGMTPDIALEPELTALFSDREGGTRLTLRITGFPPGEMSGLAAAGWNQSFDKLSELLKTGVSAKSPTRFHAEPGKQEISVSRVFNAPPETLFKAFTDPRLIPQWWGPVRFKTFIDRMAARDGGSWRFIQGDKEGNAYAFHGVYHQVMPNKRIVNTFEYEGLPGRVTLEITTFEDLGGKTRLTQRSVFDSLQARDMLLGSNMEEGVRETMERLAGLVEKESRLENRLNI